jgi:hypothetical protein
MHAEAHTAQQQQQQQPRQDCISNMRLDARGLDSLVIQECRQTTSACSAQLAGVSKLQPVCLAH